MESLWLLAGGFATALQPANLAFAFAGCLMGTLIGVLPGIGPAAGTAMLIPVVGALDPTGSIIMLAAIYYGAMYGGTITSVLANTPGEAASAVTCSPAGEGRTLPAMTRLRPASGSTWRSPPPRSPAGRGPTPWRGSRTCWARPSPTT